MRLVRHGLELVHAPRVPVAGGAGGELWRYACVCEAPRPRLVPSYLLYADHARFITLRTCSRRSYAKAFDALMVAASGRGRPLTLSQGSGQSCVWGEGRRGETGGWVERRGGRSVGRSRTAVGAARRACWSSPAVPSFARSPRFARDSRGTVRGPRRAPPSPPPRPPSARARACAASRIPSHAVASPPPRAAAASPPTGGASAAAAAPAAAAPSVFKWKRRAPGRGVGERRGPSTHHVLNVGGAEQRALATSSS